MWGVPIAKGQTFCNLTDLALLSLEVDEVVSASDVPRSSIASGSMGEEEASAITIVLVTLDAVVHLAGEEDLIEGHR